MDKSDHVKDGEIILRHKHSNLISLFTKNLLSMKEYN